jgi:threonine/homoserine/homoserine lactone efflux protein
MIPLEQLTLFILASLVILVIPGPAVLYIITRSISQGRAAGIVSVVGVNMAVFTYTVAAAFGLSAILMTSVVAFNVVKYAGAAYLIYLGVKQMISKTKLETAEVEQASLLRILGQGYVVNLLNPKMAFFTFAFLPQFVDPSHGSTIIQILLLGGLFALMAIISDGAYALLASYLRPWLQRNTQFLRKQKYVTGSVYIGLGVTAALTGQRHK